MKLLVLLNNKIHKWIILKIYGNKKPIFQYDRPISNNYNACN
jgi:hypothetical protein